MESRVAQWKRAGPITQRSEDQNLALLICFFVDELLIASSSCADLKLILQLMSGLFYFISNIFDRVVKKKNSSFPYDILTDPIKRNDTRYSFLK